MSPDMFLIIDHDVSPDMFPPYFIKREAEED
jgi:hypothetical protein